MIFSNKNRIEEYIVEILDKGPATGPALHSEIESLQGPSTKQAVYKALRSLLQDEVINKQGTRYSLNRFWLQKLNEFTDRHIEKTNTVDVNNILDFENGESVTYSFKNPFMLDITWGHLYDIVYEANPVHWANINYHPHEWLFLSRPDSERFWLDRFVQNKKMICFSIGGTSFLDKVFQKEFSSEYVKINLGESYGLKPNQYLSVTGDFVFEVTTSEEFEDAVHRLFENVNTLEELDQKQIVSISKMKYRSKLKISKNKKKANAWRNKFKQDFYIPKPYYLFEDRNN